MSGDADARARARLLGRLARLARAEVAAAGRALAAARCAAGDADARRERVRRVCEGVAVAAGPAQAPHLGGGESMRRLLDPAARAAEAAARTARAELERARRRQREAAGREEAVREAARGARARLAGGEKA